MAYVTDDDRLGFLPAAGSLLSAAGTVKKVPVIGGIVGGVLAKNKDPGRLDANAKTYAMAVAGNQWGNVSWANQAATPLDFLLLKSPTSKGGGGGWATSKAQNDAWDKYQKAKAALASKPPPKPGTGAAPAKPITPTVAALGGIGNQLPLLLAASAGLYFLSKRR